jgi:hypothetical protein
MTGKQTDFQNHFAENAAGADDGRNPEDNPLSRHLDRTLDPGGQPRSPGSRLQPGKEEGRTRENHRMTHQL